jgi:lipid II:glycine glycyltransferase (peptidoglycan interpeptide bridge formation enzyme)
MRRLGSLAYPFSFFEQLVARTTNAHWVSVVRWHGVPVAGLVTFLFKDRVMPYFIGTTNEARRCGAANFIYLTVMERGVEQGYRIFDFGRSRRDNRGSYDFKRFNGFEPRPLAYQCYTAPGCTAANLSPSNPRLNLARRVGRHLPLCVTRTVGAHLAKHIPG